MQGGLIPAHAGKTRFGTAFVSRAAAHPRSRGENATPASEETDHAGSSPLTRGKHRWTAHAGSLVGLIPAHAGKTGRPRV